MTYGEFVTQCNGTELGKLILSLFQNQQLALVPCMELLEKLGCAGQMTLGI